MSAGLDVGRPKKKAADTARSVAFRVSGRYFAWLAKLAKHNRSSFSVLFDQAIAAYAKSIGFDEEAPER